MRGQRLGKIRKEIAVEKAIRKGVVGEEREMRHSIYQRETARKKG